MTTKEVRNDGQMTGGIIEIDVHGKNTEEAKKAISTQIHSAGKAFTGFVSYTDITAARGFGACSVRNTVTEGAGGKRIEMETIRNYGAGNQEFDDRRNTYRTG